jgi:hypothetical protein
MWLRIRCRFYGHNNESWCFISQEILLIAYEIIHVSTRSLGDWVNYYWFDSLLVHLFSFLADTLTCTSFLSPSCLCAFKYYTYKNYCYKLTLFKIQLFRKKTERHMFLYRITASIARIQSIFVFTMNIILDEPWYDQGHEYMSFHIIFILFLFSLFCVPLSLL